LLLHVIKAAGWIESEEQGERIFSDLYAYLGIFKASWKLRGRRCRALAAVLGKNDYLLRDELISECRKLRRGVYFASFRDEEKFRSCLMLSDGGVKDRRSCSEVAATTRFAWHGDKGLGIEVNGLQGDFKVGFEEALDEAVEVVKAVLGVNGVYTRSVVAFGNMRYACTVSFMTGGDVVVTLDFSGRCTFLRVP
jgi:hypothetical protein